MVCLFTGTDRYKCKVCLITHTSARAHARTHTHTYIYYLRSLKFTLKHLKWSVLNVLV